MHLMYVTSSLPFSYEETWIIAEVSELQRLGHRVTLVPIRPHDAVIHKDALPLTDSTIAEPILSLRIIGATLCEIARRPTLALRSIFLLANSRILRVLLKNLAVFPKALWLARIARRQGVDHIHAHFASTNSTCALVASLFSGIPWSFTAHRWDISENNLLAEKIQAAMFARAIYARGGNQLSIFAGAHRHKVRVIHMGVVLPPQTSISEGMREGSLRVLIGARFDELKGHRYALEAVAQLKRAGVNISLDCAGDGPLKTATEKYASTLDILDRVNFTGLLDHQELLTHLHKHRWDVALLPSIENYKGHEGIPVFLIEAMAAGIPVVATNTGGTPELLKDGAGILIPQQDANAIAKALTKLDSDRQFSWRLGEAGNRRVRNEFTIGSTISALLNELSSRGTRGDSTTMECQRANEAS
jgi:colanic acid/amylovoran biosynthesis glycosyltransferase